MKSLYEVTATKTARRGDGYLVYKGYQVARSEAEAIEFAKLYISNKYDTIRASWVREAN